MTAPQFSSSWLVTFIALAALFLSPAVVIAQDDTDPPTLRLDEPMTMLAQDVFLSDELINDELLGGPMISGDGTNVVFAINRKDGENGALQGHVYRVVLPTGTPTEIATVGSSPQLDVSRNGQTVLLRTLPNSKSALYVVDQGETRLIFEEDRGVELTDAVISSEGRLVYFTIRTDTRAVGVEEPIRAGLWAIDASGSNLRPIILLDDIRDLIGAEETDALSVPATLTMDISAVADRLVFTLRNDMTGEWFVLSSRGDGQEVRVLHGPSTFVFRATISGSGSTVFVGDVAFEDETRSPRFTILSPEGGNRHEIEPVLEGGSGTATRGLMLTEDGSVLLAGSTGLLVYTVDGVTRSLLPSCPTLSQVPFSLTAPTISSTGNRVTYLGPVPGGNRLVSMDVQTTESKLAPNGKTVYVEPKLISQAEGSETTVEVDVQDNTARVCVTFRRNTDLLVDSIELNDAGDYGDQEADDGHFAYAVPNIATLNDPGPVTIRVAIETVSSAGLRTTTMFDAENLLEIIP